MGFDEMPMKFEGIYICYTPEHTHAISRFLYVKKLTQLQEEATFKEFCSMRVYLAWISNTKPDILQEITQRAQTTQLRSEDMHKKFVRRINKGVQYAQDKSGRVPFPRFSVKGLRKAEYSDAGYFSEL